MTDITDQDRRAAREWAEKIDPTYRGNSRPLLNAARVILATVDAPALSERLQYRADLLDNGDPDGDTPQALRDIATHAAQMEHDLAEARAEVKSERDLGDALAHERDDTRAELERLTAERTSKESLPVDLPDPADVKPGEAWVVEVFGERRTAVKDSDDYEAWNTFTAGGLFFPEDNEDVTLISHLVPAPRVITNPAELDALAEGSIIRAKDGEACRKTDAGDWSVDGLDGAVGYGPRQVLPATVLWEPEA